jgi:hypothetical protein
MNILDQEVVIEDAVRAFQNSGTGKEDAECRKLMFEQVGEFAEAMIPKSGGFVGEVAKGVFAARLDGFHVSREGLGRSGRLSYSSSIENATSSRPNLQAL